MGCHQHKSRTLNYRMATIDGDKKKLKNVNLVSCFGDISIEELLKLTLYHFR